MRYLLLLLLFISSVVRATEVITSDVGSWSAYGGFQTCYGYGGAKACVSDGTYFSGDGVGSGDVVFAYSASYYIYNSFTMPAGFSGSTMYLSLDLMTGPRNSEQGNKNEYVIITIQQKNSSGTVVQTNTINETISNTTMTTYDYSVTKHSDTASVYIQISGRDGGYWAGNYGAVIGAGSITLNDGASASPTTSTTTGTSGGITSAQSTSKSQARTRSNNQSDNTVYIDQVGDNNTVTIEQDGTATNTIRGIYSSGDDAGLIQGNSNTIEIRQGADTSTSSNLIEFKIIGSTNDILLYQDRLDTGYEDTLAGGGHNIILDVYGSSNDIDLIQRNNYDTYGGHFIDLEVDGSSNTINMKQISDYSKDIFGKVTGSNNSITVYQHDDSNKYLDFDLTGNGHTLDVEQTGTGAHNAEITLIYGSAPSTVNLLQQGSTDQSYSIEQTCYTLGGCSTTVTQGN